MAQSKRFPGWGSAQVAVLLEYADSRGLSLSECLEGSSIAEPILQYMDPYLDQELRVIENILALLADHPFQLGLEIGRYCNANTFGLMGQALMACRTVNDLTTLVTEHFSGEHHFLKIHPKMNKNKITTIYKVPSELPVNASQFLLGRDMGASIAFQENILKGLPSPTIEVGFIGEELPGMAEIGKYYGCPIRYHQADNYLYSHIKISQFILPLGNKLLSRILSKRIKEALSSASKAHSINSIKDKINAQLELYGYQEIDREQMAEHLFMSSRTLSRYLLSEGTTWRSLLSELRMEKAKTLLIQSNESIESIAIQLGFSSASAFSNAFSREHAISPMEFRQRSCHLLAQ